jgi:hypothetical protein
MPLNAFGKAIALIKNENNSLPLHLSHQDKCRSYILYTNSAVEIHRSEFHANHSEQPAVHSNQTTLLLQQV